MPHRLLQVQRLLRRRDRLKRIYGMSQLRPFHDLNLGIKSRIPQRQPQEEAVTLCLRQQERSLMLQRILCGDHVKWVRQRMCHAVHRHLPLLHRFQQRRLRFGRAAVDLVGEEDVGQDGAGPKLELARALVIEVDADHVRRQQIRSELHPLERCAK